MLVSYLDPTDNQTWQPIFDSHCVAYSNANHGIICRVSVDAAKCPPIPPAAYKAEQWELSNHNVIVGLEMKLFRVDPKDRVTVFAFNMTHAARIR